MQIAPWVFPLTEETASVPPHVRGKGHALCLRLQPRGSPPRVRGKDDHRAQHIHRHGITPACAGKRQSAMRWTRPSWDHPRVCGEKRQTVEAVTAEQGSPPRVRGKVTLSGTVEGEVGITPACAGKRFPSPQKSLLTRDHPRVCGEKCTGGRVKYGKIGSPPRVRGKDLVCDLLPLRAGITPACAGKSADVVCPADRI